MGHHKPGIALQPIKGFVEIQKCAVKIVFAERDAEKSSENCLSLWLRMDRKTDRQTDRQLTDRRTCWGHWGSEEFPSCWKLIRHPVFQAKKWWVSSLPATLLSPPLYLSVFNLPLLCQSPTLSCSLQQLPLIGGADDHTVSTALLSVFNSYLAHSTRLFLPLCAFGRIFADSYQNRFFASGDSSASTWALCYIVCAKKRKGNFSAEQQQTSRLIIYQPIYMLMTV